MGFRSANMLKHLHRSTLPGHRGQFLILGLWFLVFQGSVVPRCEGQHAAPHHAAAMPVRDKDGYTGSQACAGCHATIYEKYMKTDMGRSMSAVTPEVMKRLGLPASYFDRRMNRHYEVFARNGKVFQSEFETDGKGTDVFRTTHPLRWIIGSGAILGGIVERDGYLFEAPLALYTKPMVWKQAPGYEFADYSFSRPILTGCVSCHSGRSNPVPDTNGRYEATVFSELAIGCENCHGPGSAHIETMSKDSVMGSVTSNADTAIVNPARLSMQLANDICMKCHEIGDERILQAGKSYKDVRPGAPLDRTLSILMVPPTPKSVEQSDHLEHYYSMTLSKCFRASGGKLGCISCHDPHVQPGRQEAPGASNARCLTCHTDASCTQTPEARQATTPADNCIGCHMPKRDVTFIAHTSLTNHRIVKRPDEPYPAEMLEQTTAALPDLIHLNPAPGAEGLAPPLLTLLQAYAELAPDRPEYVAPYFALLDKLSATEQDNSLVQTALASRDIRDGKLPEAIEHLQRALKIGPAQASVYALLADALAKSGRGAEALSAQRKAIAQDPFNPNLQKTLVSLLLERKQYADAKSAAKQYLETFPQDSNVRNLLGAKAGASQ